MTQRVPRWDLEESCHDSARLSFHADSSSAFDNEVAELTWENGQLAMHGLVTPKPPPATPAPSKYSWEKPRAGGTLECIVDQATSLPPPKGDELVLWFEHHLRSTAKDALVPCSVSTHSARGASTKVGSCSGSSARREASPEARKRTRVAGEWSSGDPSLSLSASASRHVTMDTCEVDTNVSLGSQEQTSLGKALSSRTKTTSVDEHDSCYSKPQREEESGDEEKRKRGRSFVSRKSKAAAIHNQSERKRRDRINQKMKTLQKLVPNSCKTDKASMLDEVIEYLKQLQAQVQMMSKMSSIPQLMAMQQLQMSMMAQMSMMGVMDANCLNRTCSHGCHAPSTLPSVLHPAVFLPMTAAWGGSGDRLPQPGGVLPDPLTAAFLACQTQPYNLDAYNRMAALYHQTLQQSTGAAPPISKT